MKKSKMGEKDFNLLLDLLLKKVLIIPARTLKHHKKQAMEIIKEIDKNDVIFIACALAYPNSILWSEDKKLKNQKEITVLSTKEIIGFLK